MAQSTDVALPSTVQDIVADCPQFRILVIGKTGCGKSSLINEVFGVKVAQVSHKDPGKADINLGFCPEDNIRFILHDSQGFEPGEDANYNTVKNFIEERSRMPRLKDRLHAIWICTTTPIVGDRIMETGVEHIVKMDHGHVPIIVVFTKYDELVHSAIFEITTEQPDLDDEQLRLSGKKKAEEVFETLCAGPLGKTFGMVPVLAVSKQYKQTIARLIEVTDKEIQRSLHDDSHTQPTSLAWVIAQRGSSDTNIKASIGVGRKRYWIGLLSSADFTGQKLKRCLDVIHGDIVSVWNIHDPDSYLTSDDFKAKISAIVDDLVTNPSIPTSGDALSVSTVTMLATAASSPVGFVITTIGSTIIFAKWVFEVYHNTPGNIACIMGYVVDLTIIMHLLFKADLSHESIVSQAIAVVSDYSKSGKLAQVHSDIRKFINERNLLRWGEDNVLNEIIRLIEKHCIELK